MINALEQFETEQRTRKHIAPLRDDELLKQIQIDGIIQRICLDEMINRIKRRMRNV